MTFDQQEFDIRCEWGEQGVAHLAPISDVCIIVDILSFPLQLILPLVVGRSSFPVAGATKRLRNMRLNLVQN